MDVSDIEGTADRAEGDITTLARKFVRYALSCDYSRTPIRRSDISQKVFGTTSAPFRRVFELTQHQLQNVFGMELQELPSKEKVTVQQRRAAAQKGEGKSKGSNAWILVRTLPKEYCMEEILGVSAQPTAEDEAAYVGLYTMVVALIYAAQDRLAESRLERYLSRMFIDKNTPIGTTSNVMKRMERDGYIVRTRDTSSGEEIIEFVVGPRAKVEVDRDSVARLMESMYGGADVPEDFYKRLERTLGKNTVSTTGARAYQNVTASAARDEGEDASDGG